MFDTVTIEDAHTSLGIKPGTGLQTKNLGSYLAHFRVAKGRLESLNSGDWVDEDFHGDILLSGHAMEIVARFTDGSLEWIRDARVCRASIVKRLRGS
ncbi:MAG: hypothetical protein JNM99_14705 [Verrucomicrobiaceae bacterium]|nr:hypothetical protein [Verrucomicrobiaceae bacterium]